jgi:hypothetical protein
MTRYTVNRLIAFTATVVMQPAGCRSRGQPVRAGIDPENIITAVRARRAPIISASAGLGL